LSSFSSSFFPFNALTHTIMHSWSGRVKLLVVSLLFLYVALQPFVGLRPLSQFLNLYTVGSPSQGHYLHTEIHASSGIRTHDPDV
jgi:hypothetical protein